MSRLYQHMSRYYEELDSKAKDELQDEGIILRVFRGKVVNVFRSLEIPQSYYSKVRTSLINMGCITILQQGARGSNSILVLHHPPEKDEFDLHREDALLTPRLDSAILSQELKDIKKLLGGVNVVEALYDLQTELNDLRRKVEKLGKTAPTPQRRVS